MTSQNQVPPELAGRCILVVEDEWVVASHIDDELTQMGCHVVGPVPSVDEALALIKDEKVDAAVLDVNLRSETSYPLAEVLRARKVPIVFLTGYHATNLAPGFRNIPCLEKPTGPQGLAVALAAALANANTARTPRGT